MILLTIKHFFIVKHFVFCILFIEKTLLSTNTSSKKKSKFIGYIVYNGDQLWHISKPLSLKI